MGQLIPITEIHPPKVLVVASAQWRAKDPQYCVNPSITAVCGRIVIQEELFGTRAIRYIVFAFIRYVVCDSARYMADQLHIGDSLPMDLRGYGYSLCTPICTHDFVPLWIQQLLGRSNVGFFLAASPLTLCAR